MSGSRDWRDKGYEFIPFIPKKKEHRIPVPQRPVVVDQEAAERRRECIRRVYGMRGARDGDREIVLPTQEEFDRTMYYCEGDGNGNGEEDPDVRSFMERIVREVLGEEEIGFGDGEKVRPEDSEKKDSTPKNDKEEDGDVIKGEMMKSAAEIQEADEKGSACPGKADAVLNVRLGDGQDPIGVDGQAGRSLAEGGEARLATGDIECRKKGRDGAENLAMPMDDEEGNAEDSDEVKTVVGVGKPSSAVVACKNGDEGIVGNVEVKLEGATSGPGEKEPVGAEIEAEAPVPEPEQEVPAPETEGQAVAAAAIDGQNGNEGSQKNKKSTRNSKWPKHKDSGT